MIACVHAIGDYGMNERNFVTIRKFIRTLLSMVQVGSNRLKMVHIKASHMPTIWGLYFRRSKFPCLDLFRYLQAVVFVPYLCSFSFFLVFSISVMYLAIFWQHPFFFALFWWCLLFASLPRLFVSFYCSAAL